jgi:hypothetical protein
LGDSWIHPGDFRLMDGSWMICWCWDGWDVMGVMICSFFFLIWTADRQRINNG